MLRLGAPRPLMLPAREHSYLRQSDNIGSCAVWCLPNVPLTGRKSNGQTGKPSRIVLSDAPQAHVARALVDSKLAVHESGRLCHSACSPNKQWSIEVQGIDASLTNIKPEKSLVRKV